MPRPIFIIGSPRSATSALTWALGQHPNISLQPETNWIPQIARSIRDAYRVGIARGTFSQLSNAGLPFETFAAHFGSAVDAISRECFVLRVKQFIPHFFDDPESAERLDPSSVRLVHDPLDPKARWVDGTPENSFSTFELKLLFPECRFIHILRRPEEVVNSLANFENVGADGKNVSYKAAIDIWSRHTLAAHRTAVAFGRKSVFRLDNRSLSNDSDAALKSCFDFLEEAHSKRAVAVLKNKMNSSKAPERLERTKKDIGSRADFVRARALYDELNTASIPDDADPSTFNSMREEFERAR